MATFIETNSSSRSILKSLISSQSVGREGQELNEKINEVTQSIQKPEYIRNLLLSWIEANKNQQEILWDYLESLKLEALENKETQFTVVVLEYSWLIWKSLSCYFFDRGLCLEVPDACPGENNDFMYTWSKAEHYLECEVFGDGAVEFFYRHRKSGDVWGEDTTLEKGFSASILEKASLFSW